MGILWIDFPEGFAILPHNIFLLMCMGELVPDPDPGDTIPGPEDFVEPNEWMDVDDRVLVGLTGNYFSWSEPGDRQSIEVSDDSME